MGAKEGEEMIHRQKVYLKLIVGSILLVLGGYFVMSLITSNLYCGWGDNTLSFSGGYCDRVLSYVIPSIMVIGGVVLVVFALRRKNK